MLATFSCLAALALAGDSGAPAAAPAPAAKSASTMEYISVESKKLGRSVTVGVYTPPGYAGAGQKDERYPLLVFLHGMFGDAHKWAERDTPMKLDDLITSGAVPPMIVACPDGENSMYVNWISGDAPWEDFIALELVAAIDAKYRTRTEAKFRGISGDSMGGFGALNLAFHHPDVFGSVSAHSAALFPADPAKLSGRAQSFAEQWKDVFGYPVDVEHWKKNNPIYLAETAEVEQLRRLAIYFDCGEKDRFGFNVTNELLAKVLEDREVPHEWHLRSGNHGAAYFSTYVKDSLEFHGKAFAAADGKGAAAAPPAAEGSRKGS